MIYAEKPTKPVDPDTPVDPTAPAAPSTPSAPAVQKLPKIGDGFDAKKFLVLETSLVAIRSIACALLLRKYMAEAK